jgi:hypothetical protein
MTDTTVAHANWHPPHALMSWPAVLAGAVVAVAVGAMLNLLGVALGAASFNPYALDSNDAAEFTAAAGMWMALANAIALFVGGAVASRVAKHPDHHKGALHGVGVWGAAFLLALILATASAAGGAAAIAGGEAADPTVEVRVDPVTGARSQVIEGELAPPLPAAREAVDDAADATATLALWGFLTMLIGAVAAIVGGMYGARPHRWMAKAGLDSHADAVAPVHATPQPATPHRVYPTPRS